MIQSLFLLLMCTGALASKRFPEVTIEQGDLTGSHRVTWNGRVINSFIGIPYAQPPVGKLRFKSPLPAEPWVGVLNATSIAPACPQSANDEFIGSEDCLYLNVFTPKLGRESLLPVMFFIHGGGLVIGSGTPNFSGPDILLDKDVVLVTINYRLGAFGFLSTEDELVPGNWGLKDQNLALRWVKKNIAHFGGDPCKITVFGHSSGGVSTHYHVVSPLSKDLISGAIAQSGTAVLSLTFAPKGLVLTNTKRLAGFLNCPNEDKENMIECLKKVDAKDIIAQEKKFMVFTNDPLTPFKVVIEPNIEGAFLIEDPIDTIISGKSAKIPFISGLTTDDGAVKSASLYNDPNLIDQLNKNFTTLLPIILMYEDHPNKIEISNKIRRFYFGNGDINNNTKAELTNLFTDAWFLYPHVAAVLLHAKYTSNPVYSYIFGIHGKLSFGRFYGDPEHDYGVVHGDELIYLFNTVTFDGYRPNKTERKVFDIMITLWTDFASTGNPTPKTNSLIRNKWEITKSGIVSSYFFNNADDIKMVNDKYKERVEFWLNLPINSRDAKIKELL